jgi:hypothetical protein
MVATSVHHVTAPENREKDVTKSSSNATWKKPHLHQLDGSSASAGPAAPDWSADAARSDDTLSAGVYFAGNASIAGYGNEAASSSDLVPDDTALFYSSPDDGGDAFAPPPGVCRANRPHPQTHRPAPIPSSP